MTVIFSILVMGIIGALFGLALAVLDKKLKVIEDPAVEQIAELLPGLNCGGCGEAGCMAYAKFAVKNKDLGQGCAPAGDEAMANIASILGLDHTGVAKVKLISRCSAKREQQINTFEYRGPQSCKVAHVAGGSIDCKYGCLGLADCLKVCPVNALSIEDGTVIIDNQTCIDCGACVKACPRDILCFADVGDAKDYYVVGCNNPEDGKSTKGVCQAGCIGCAICIKLVKDSPYYMEDKISRLNYKEAEKRDDLDIAMQKCPTKVIYKYKN